MYVNACGCSLESPVCGNWVRIWEAVAGIRGKSGEIGAQRPQGDGGKGDGEVLGRWVKKAPGVSQSDSPADRPYARRA